MALATLLLQGCGTRPKTYQPPNSKKMDEARQRLSTDVDRATEKAKKVHEHVGAAQVSAAKVVKFSGTIEVKLGQLHARVTPELRPVVEDIQTDVASIKQEEGVLTETLNQAIAAERGLAVDLTQAQMDKGELSKESEAFKAEAQTLADAATAERDARIKAEKSLSWYRWHGWLVKIGTTLVVIALIVLAFLWFTGRLAMKL